VDAGSVLTVNGSYTQSSAGTLGITLGGSPASGKFGKVAVTGAASLAGTLAVSTSNNFTPGLGQNFQILTYASNSGTFTTVTGVNFANGIFLKPVYAATNLTLQTQAAPVATGTTVNGTEGASFTAIVATFTDANPNTNASSFTATIHWGDGTTSAGTISGTQKTGFSVTGTHTFGEEGNHAFTVVVATKSNGASSTANSTAVIADASLAAAGVNISAVKGTSFTGTVATFTDADPAGVKGDYTATITWGDGTKASAGTVASDGHGGFTVTGTHTYTKAGTFTIKVVIKDKGGSSITVTSTATVSAAAADLSLLDALFQAWGVSGTTHHSWWSA
jgi:hypothetical protein